MPRHGRGGCRRAFPPLADMVGYGNREGDGSKVVQSPADEKTEGAGLVRGDSNADGAVSGGDPGCRSRLPRKRATAGALMSYGVRSGNLDALQASEYKREICGRLLCLNRG